MHIYLKRSGGFMGMPLQTDLDTSALPAEEAEAIEQMLVDACFFDLPSDSAQVNAADRFTYEMKVVSEEVEHTVYFSEQNAPVEMTTLVRRLTILARSPAPGAADDPDAPEDKSP